MLLDLWKHLIVICTAVFLTFAVEAHCEDHTAGPDPQAEPSATAELGRPNHRFFNVHLSAGAAFGLDKDLQSNEDPPRDLGELGGQATLGLDFVVFEPLAFSILAGYSAFRKEEGEFRALDDLYIGAGFRLRLFADRNGALSELEGNVLGNLWLDAHISFHHYEVENHGGVNAGIGYEFSLFKNFNVGPYVRYFNVPWGDGIHYRLIAVGLQVSQAGQFEPDDRDRDGIVDGKDDCPNDPEDLDGFKDDDGCFDTDNDGDHIIDEFDKCPNQPENLNGVNDDDGCPEDDSDFDGIKDRVDQCKLQAEDQDGHQDEDGCPEPDNDGDGIYDESDKCPFEPEDKDGFEETDGCPDLDNDGDGLPDEQDHCPNLPETKNQVQDEDGCPDLIQLVGNQIKLLQPIEFKPRGDAILEKSYPILEEVTQVLKSTGLKLRIEGHTDDRGNAKQNLDLSVRRAAAVKQFLVERGIAPKRMVSTGLGGTKPMVSNKTKAGRIQNRRIELFLDGDQPAKLDRRVITGTKADAKPESAPTGAKKQGKLKRSQPKAAPKKKDAVKPVKTAPTKKDAAKPSSPKAAPKKKTTP